MMNVTSLKGRATGGAAAVAAYIEHTRSGSATDASTTRGYYQSGTSPISWGGSVALAAQLGVLIGDGAEFRGADLTALLSGINPATRAAFAKLSEGRRMGADLTFSAPKSISIAALAGGDDRLLAAHDAAVREAMAVIQSQFATARYGHGGVTVERTGAILYAAARHEDARAVDGLADPDLHTHCVVINATDGRDGQIRGLDLAFGSDGVKLSGAIYRSNLARRVRELGYDLRASPEGFELSQITDKDIDEMSGRRRQIVVALAEKFCVSFQDATAAQKQAAVMGTRGAKTQLGHEAQRAQWHERGVEMALDLQPPRVPESLGAPRVTTGEAIKHLSERETVFSRDAVRLFLLTHFMERGVDLHAVDEAIDRAREAGQIHDLGSDHPIALRRGSIGDTLYISRASLVLESDLLATARAGRGTMQPIMPAADSVRACIDQAATLAGFAFSHDQISALTLALQSQDQITGIVGAAGVGKTTVMRPVAYAAREAGFEVLGLTTSAAAAAELAGAVPNATTIARFSLGSRPAPTDPPMVIILDEAGMVCTRAMATVVKRLRPQDRLLVVGDYDQIRAVEAGLPFYQMIREGAVRHERNSSIIRQRTTPDLLAVVQRFADGDAVGAIALAVSRYVREVAPATPRAENESRADYNARVRAAMVSSVAQRYMTLSPTDRASTLVLAGTRAGVAAANLAIRARLIERGELGPHEKTLQVLTRSGMTTAETGRGRSYAPGMIVRWSEHSQRGQLPTPVSLEVVAVDYAKNIAIMRPEGGGPEREVALAGLADRHAAIFEPPRDLNLREGDQVVFTATDRSRGTTNNARGVIAAVSDGSVTIRLQDGTIQTLNTHDAHTLNLAYASTVHRAQGQTCDRVIALADGRGSAEMAYVAISRARHAVDIVTANSAKLSADWSRWSDRDTARSAIRESAEGWRGVIDGARASARAEIERDAAMPTSPVPTLAKGRDYDCGMSR